MLALTSKLARPLHLGVSILPPIFPSHLQTTSHLPISISHLASCRFHLPHLPASGRHLEFRAVCICHRVHLVHLIYAIRAHLNLGRASRPLHLPSCHPEMEIQIWVFTSGRASPHCLSAEMTASFLASFLSLISLLSSHPIASPLFCLFRDP